VKIIVPLLYVSLGRIVAIGASNADKTATALAKG